MPATRKAAIKKTPAVKPPPLTEDQKQAKLEAYYALKSADLPIPAELQEVEAWIADIKERQKAEAVQWEAEREQEAQQIAQANQNGPWYVRNGYVAPFSLRLDRQTEKRRIELKARGMPGDLHPIKEEDLNDPILKQNVAIGVIEIIPAGEAALIMEKQTTNMGRREHTPLAILRSEYDKPYAQGAVKVEAEFNQQGVTVAQVDRRVMTGELSDREIKNAGGLTRTQPGQAPPAPQDANQATSIVRSGFVPTGGNQAIIQYGPTGPTGDAHARAVDDLARRHGPQGPAAGLGNIQVVVEPTRKT